MIRNDLVSVILATSLVLAGCVDDDAEGDEPDVNTVHFVFSDDGDGQVKRDTAECDDDANVAVMGEIADGFLQVVLLDGNGTEVFNETYHEDVRDERIDDIPGAPGTWTVIARHIPNDDGRFSAAYSVDFVC